MRAVGQASFEALSQRIFAITPFDRDDTEAPSSHFTRSLSYLAAELGFETGSFQSLCSNHFVLLPSRNTFLQGPDGGVPWSLLSTILIK